MVHYTRSRRVDHWRDSQRWRQRLTALTCLVLIICLLETGAVRIFPANLTKLFGPTGSLMPHLSNNRHAGSSGPPPQGVVSGLSTTLPPASSNIQAIGCRVFGTSHAGLGSSSVPTLRKLATYEQLCSGAVAQRSSFFVPTPSTPAQAQASAQAVAATLLAYAHYRVKPLVFMEPVDPNGHMLDLAQFAGSTYDSTLATYYAGLKVAGVTSSTLGLWVYLPEGNLPVWSTTDPNVYDVAVTKLARLQKLYFPGSQASIMLDSESYAVGSTWGNGKYLSLLPYVQAIPKGLLDSFGLQGFPWAAPANQPAETSLYNPAVYLRTNFAIQAAQTLAVKNIWFNTGTFGQMYVGQAGATVAASTIRRQQLLDSVIELARTIKAKGYTVEIHLFAENKAKSGEATDWSYWRAKPGDSPATAVFTTFAHDAAVNGVPLWLYDS